MTVELRGEDTAADGRTLRSRALYVAIVLGGLGLALPSSAEISLDSLDLLPPEVDVQPVGDLRLRTRVDASRDLRSEPDPATRFPSRARLGVQVGYDDSLAGRLLLGGNANLGEPAADAGLFIDEAYVEGRLPWAGGLARLRFGRQALQQGAGRQISSDEFLDRPRRLDALRATAALAEFELDSFVALLGDHAELARGPGRTGLTTADLLAGLALGWHLSTLLDLRLQVLGLLGEPVARVDDASSEGDLRQPVQMLTLGLDSVLRPATWLTLDSGLAVQLGETRALEQLAHDLHLTATLRAPLPGHPALRIGYELSSGDRQPFDNRGGDLVNPLGSRHDRYGAADLLYPANAADLWLSVGVEDELSWLRLSLHRLSLASGRDAWIDASGQVLASPGDSEENLLGHEIDLEGWLALHDQVAIELLYAMFLPDGAGRDRVGTRAAHRLLVGCALSF